MKPIEIFLGIVMILCVIEAVRRCVSPVMAILVAIFLLYLPLGQYMPGFLKHKGLSLPRLIESLYLTTGEGFYGSLTGTSATYIAIFVLLGSFIVMVGAGDFFTKLARAVAGGARGGPAKIAVISSSLFGTISGSAVANVYGTGTFTIPLMKSLGFRPDFAGAVEAVASTGGQLMPPVMGAAAFIVADFLSMRYAELAMRAFIPAILYYFSLYTMIDLECARTGILGERKETLPKLKEVCRESYLLVPIVTVFYLMLRGYSASYAAFATIIVSFLTSFVSRKTWMTPRKLIVALEDGAKNAAMVAVALAGASVIVVSLTYSGLGLSLTSAVLALSHGNRFLLLVFVAVTAIILGMGVPTTPAYVIAAALGVPMLTRAGFTPLASHMFVLYFAVISNITPPVAVAAYAGANIAKADPMRTGIIATRLGTIAYVVPFMFAYQPVLLGSGSALSIIWTFATALVGTYAVACAMQGWFVGKVPAWLRCLLGLAGLCLVHPGANTDAVGFLILGLALVQRLVGKRITRSATGKV